MNNVQRTPIQDRHLEKAFLQDHCLAKQNSFWQATRFIPRELLLPIFVYMNSYNRQIVNKLYQQWGEVTIYTTKLSVTQDRRNLTKKEKLSHLLSTSVNLFFSYRSLGLLTPHDLVNTARDLPERIEPNLPVKSYKWNRSGEYRDQIPDTLNKCQLFLTLSHNLIEHNNRDKAIEMLNKAIETLKRMSLKGSKFKKAGPLLNRSGESYNKNNDIKIVDELPDSWEKAEIFLIISSQSRVCGNRDRAIEFLNKAIEEVDQEIPNSWENIQVFLVIYRELIEIGSRDVAIEFMSEMIEKNVDQMTDPEEKSEFLVGLYNQIMESGDEGLTVKAINKAIETVEVIPNARAKCNKFLMISYHLTYLKDLDRAMKAINKAIEAVNEITGVRMKCNQLLKISNQLMQFGNINEAREVTLKIPHRNRKLNQLRKITGCPRSYNDPLIKSLYHRKMTARKEADASQSYNSQIANPLYDTK